MGILSYSEKEANKILSKALVEFLGGNTELKKRTKTNESAVAFLKSKNLFGISGIGSLEALSEESKDQLGASFRGGFKNNDFSEFLNYISFLNPRFSVGNEIGETFIQRYEDFFINSASNERKRKAYEDRVNRLKLTPSSVTKKILIDSFDTSVINEGYMGAAIKSSKVASASDVVSLLVSANKVLSFYKENEKSLEHYRSSIQKLMFEDGYEKIEKDIKKDPIIKQTKAKKAKYQNKFSFVTSVFDGVKPEKESKKSSNKEDKKQQNNEFEESQQESIKMKKTGYKILKPNVVEDLEKMGVDSIRLELALTRENAVKYYLARKNKATIQDVKDISYADERIRTLVLTPVYKAFAKIENIKWLDDDSYGEKFDPSNLSKKQIELFCKLADPEKKDFSEILTRMENYSTITKNILDKCLIQAESSEFVMNFKNSDQIRYYINRALFDTNILAKTDYNDFVSGFISLAFEPSVKNLINQNTYYPNIEVNENSPEKINVGGYVKVDGEILRVENIPVSLVTTETGKKVYSFRRATFSPVELEKFKNDLKLEYGCNPELFNSEEDVFIGENTILSSLHILSSENRSEKLAKINDSPITREFLTTHKPYREEELKKVCEQVNVISADYSIFKNEVFYKNAREKAYEKAMEEYLLMKSQAESQKYNPEDQQDDSKTQDYEDEQDYSDAQDFSKTQDDESQDHSKTQDAGEQDHSKTQDTGTQDDKKQDDFAKTQDFPESDDSDSDKKTSDKTSSDQQDDKKTGKTNPNIDEKTSSKIDDDFVLTKSNLTGLPKTHFSFSKIKDGEFPSKKLSPDLQSTKTHFSFSNVVPPFSSNKEGSNEDFIKNDTSKKLSDGLEPVLVVDSEIRAAERKKVSEQSSKQQSTKQSTSTQSKTNTIEISLEEEQKTENVKNSSGAGTSTPKPKEKTSPKRTPRKTQRRNKKQTETPKEEEIQPSKPIETPKEEENPSSQTPSTVVEQKLDSKTTKNLKIQESSSETTQTIEKEEKSSESTQKSEEQENLSKINFETIEMPKNENYLGSQIDEFVSKGGDKNAVEGFKHIFRTRIRNSTNLNFCEKEFEQQELDRINSIEALNAYAKRYICLNCPSLSEIFIECSNDSLITEINEFLKQEREKTEEENSQQKNQNVEVKDSEIKPDEQASALEPKTNEQASGLELKPDEQEDSFSQ